jgi:NUMOD3 motif/NUMOD1 domain
MFGKLHNEDTLAKMSAAKQGKLHSEETRVKMSISKAGEKHPMFGKIRAVGAGSSPKRIEVLDLLTDKRTIYESISAAALDLGIKQSAISLYFHRNQKSAYKGKYVFRFLV